MKISTWLIGLVGAAVLSLPTNVRAETASQAFARGNQALAAADFEEAYRAYYQAARADRKNREYSQQAMLIRQVVMLRKELAQGQDSARWRQVGQALRSFYVSESLHSEALAVDERLHAKLNTAASASQLAESYLAMDADAQASNTLESLDAQLVTPTTQALLGVALARQGEKPAASKLAAGIETAEDATPAALYTLARLQASLGNDDKALPLLARCFEGIAPSRLAEFKKQATENRDLARLASTPGFQTALKTESKVSESACSSGSSCAGCPSRGSCPSGR